MKKHWTAQLASELIESKIIDPNAETLEEIAAARGIGGNTARRAMLRLIAAGKVEQVWKMGTTRLVPAYRVKK